MRILFITANRIGDATLTTGLLGHLADTYPQARFTVACGPAAADLFRAAPGLERLFLLKKQKRWGHWLALWRACAGTRWDIIVDLRNSLVTRLLFAKKKYYKLPHNTGRHKVADHAAAMGLEPPPAPRLWLDEAARRRADDILSEGSLFLALGPSANWPPKQWPAYRFADLAERLTAPDGPLPDAKILLIAAPHEAEQLAPLFAKLPPDRIVSVVGEDLLTVAACMKRAALFVGNDSGLTHMAAAMGAPTLALFGPGWENIYGPWGEHTAVIRPPFGSQELLDRLPFVGAEEPNLMEDLTVEDAFEAARRLIEREKERL